MTSGYGIHSSAIYSVVNNKRHTIRCYCGCGNKNMQKKLENDIYSVYSHIQTLHT